MERISLFPGPPGFFLISLPSLHPFTPPLLYIFASIEVRRPPPPYIIRVRTIISFPLYYSSCQESPFFISSLSPRRHTPFPPLFHFSLFCCLRPANTYLFLSTETPGTTCIACPPLCSLPPLCCRVFPPHFVG